MHLLAHAVVHGPALDLLVQTLDGTSAVGRRLSMVSWILDKNVFHAVRRRLGQGLAQRSVVILSKEIEALLARDRVFWESSESSFLQK